jgi:CBS domain-containing protein
MDANRLRPKFKGDMVMKKNSVDVNDYMVKRPVLVHPDTELFEAIHQILRHKISGMTVVDDNKHPVGMLSELDCLRAILSGSYYGEETGTILVKDHMSTEVEDISSHADVISIAQSMLDHKHRRRPVVNGQNQVVGQLTCRNLLKCIKDFDVPSRWFEG